MLCRMGLTSETLQCVTSPVNLLYPLPASMWLNMVVVLRCSQAISGK